MTKMLLTVALLCASLSLQGTGSAHASSQPDQVIQWNRMLLQILQTPGAQPATIHPTRARSFTQPRPSAPIHGRTPDVGYFLALNCVASSAVTPAAS